MSEFQCIHQVRLTGHSRPLAGNRCHKTNPQGTGEGPGVLHLIKCVGWPTVLCSSPPVLRCCRLCADPAAPHSETLTTNGHRHGPEGAAQTDVHPGASGDRQDHHGHRDHLWVDCHGQGPHLGHCLLQQGYAVVQMQREGGFSTPDPPKTGGRGGGVREMGSIDRTINQLL